MTSAANILTAVGGHPEMNTRDFVPVYPMLLPFLNFTVGLEPFSPHQIMKFRRIEESSWGPDHPEGQPGRTVAVWYWSIVELLDMLVSEHGEGAVFTGDPRLQVNVGSSRGQVPSVGGHLEAKRILIGILAEGGGDNSSSLYDLSPFRNQTEHPHFLRFQEVLTGRQFLPADALRKGDRRYEPTGRALDRNWSAAYKCTPNPKARYYKAYPSIFRTMMDLNARYTNLLAGLHHAFNYEPDSFNAMIGSMYTLGGLARQLMATPDPLHPGNTVGPSWEWINVTAWTEERKKGTFSEAAALYT